jgi:hypothetical protein
MPRIESWDNLPANVRQHLIDRMHERTIRIRPEPTKSLDHDASEVPDGDWYKDFGSFKICGRGSYPKTFLLRSQAAKGKTLSFSYRLPAPRM